MSASTGCKPTIRTYLLAEEQAIVDAMAAYQRALADLQAACEHRTVLRHEGKDYKSFRVCEDCGITCIAAWDSPVHAKGERSLLGKRYYAVDWPTFARTTAAVKLEGQTW